MELVYSIRNRLDQYLPSSYQLLALLLLLAATGSALLPGYRPLPSAGISTPVSARLPELPQITEPRITAAPLQPAAPANGDEAGYRDPVPDNRLFLTVKSGDNLSLLFKRAGLGASALYELVNALPESEQLSRLFPGYRLAFELEQQKLLSLELYTSMLHSYRYARAPEGSFEFREIERKPDLKLVYRETVIRDSMFVAARHGNIPDAKTIELAAIFGGIIDFIKDTRQGDSFSVLYEEEYFDGKFIGNGRIIAASFINRGTPYTALYYENEAGESNYFNQEGVSLRRTFLHNPVHFTRISSGFSLSREHPLLKNTTRPHYGTDYVAPRGTPVVATADGKVSFASRKGSFGKLVVLEHGKRFQTKYAHLDAFARGIKSGAEIKQGQIIGYVGSTGGATGAHLHYEFLMDGVHRNYLAVHEMLPKVASVAPEEMERFRQQTAVSLSMLETHGGSSLLAKSSDDK